ncbi:Rieske (2Fe-2S) protein [Actinopolymorpha alba]|uniref:Rieske (2Fe-2S) protein n=1 Tax=Actinopolymorpha alba TaxID=533267 RepID=UPI00036B7280|nr:Rieske 2Fe-2S domain-containing protein [Actinopolymorpha alba]
MQTFEPPTPNAAPIENAVSENAASALTRRRVLGCLALAGAAVPILVACGGGDDTTSTSGDDSAATPTEQESTPAKETPSAEETTPESTAAAAVLAKTSDIPVAGGKVFPDQKVVVTQPEAGTFKAFSAVCTHKGNLVRNVQSGTIICPFHQSRFSATDGSVQSGPATRPLPAAQIKVDGDSITLA